MKASGQAKTQYLGAEYIRRMVTDMENVSAGLVIGAMLLLAVAILVLNDRIKARAYRKAMRQGRQPRWGLANHNTSWRIVARFVVLGALCVAVAFFVPGLKWSGWTTRALVFVAVGLVGGAGFIWRLWKLSQASALQLDSSSRRSADEASVANVRPAESDTEWLERSRDGMLPLDHGQNAGGIKTDAVSSVPNRCGLTRATSLPVASIPKGPPPTTAPYGTTGLTQLIWRNWCLLFSSREAILRQNYRMMALGQGKDVDDSMSLDQLRVASCGLPQCNEQAIVSAFRAGESRLVLCSRLVAAWFVWWASVFPLLVAGVWLLGRLNTLRANPALISSTLIKAIALLFVALGCGLCIQGFLARPLTAWLNRWFGSPRVLS